MSRTPGVRPTRDREAVPTSPLARRRAVSVERRAGTDWSARPSSTNPGRWRLMSSETEIRSFRVDMPDEAIAGLRQRIADARWPTRELVADRSQGVQLATLAELARYWAAEYDWRVRGEAERADADGRIRPAGFTRRAGDLDAGPR